MTLTKIFISDIYVIHKFITRKGTFPNIIYVNIKRLHITLILKKTKSLRISQQIYYH